MLTNISLQTSDVLSRSLVSATALEVFSAMHPEAQTVRWGEMLSLYVVDELLKTGDVTIDEAKVVVGALEESAASCEGKECDIVVVRKMGVATVALVSSSAHLVFDSAARQIARINLTGCMEALSARMRAYEEAGR